MHPLVPRWYAALAVVLTLLGCLAGLLMALVETGSLRVLGAALAWSFGCLTVAAVSALTPAARRLGLGRVRTAPDGSWAVRAPATTVVPLLGAWAGAFAAAGAAALVWVDAWPRVWEAVDRPGNLALVVVGTVATLPDVVRLARGRLHWWELSGDAATVRYRGWRSSHAWERGAVRGGRLHPRHPSGVEVDVRGTRRDGVVVPSAAFALLPDEVDALLSRGSLADPGAGSPRC